MKYICECCGEEKEDWPAIAYNAPSLYENLSDEELTNSELTSDLCTIRYRTRRATLSELCLYRKLKKAVRI